MRNSVAFPEILEEDGTFSHLWLISAPETASSEFLQRQQFGCKISPGPTEHGQWSAFLQDPACRTVWLTDATLRHFSPERMMMLADEALNLDVRGRAAPMRKQVQVVVTSTKAPATPDPATVAAPVVTPAAAPVTRAPILVAT